MQNPYLLRNSLRRQRNSRLSASLKYPGPATRWLASKPQRRLRALQRVWFVPAHTRTVSTTRKACASIAITGSAARKKPGLASTREKHTIPKVSASTATWTRITKFGRHRQVKWLPHKGTRANSRTPPMQRCWERMPSCLRWTSSVGVRSAWHKKRALEGPEIANLVNKRKSEKDYKVLQRANLSSRCDNMIE